MPVGCKCIEVASCGLRCSRGDRRMELLLVGRILGLRIDSGYLVKKFDFDPLYLVPERPGRSLERSRP